jgi:hypothetical protein
VVFTMGGHGRDWCRVSGEGEKRFAKQPEKLAIR